jgi:eukaryotic-like serine/threonine-protein kinase
LWPSLTLRVGVRTDRGQYRVAARPRARHGASRDHARELPGQHLQPGLHEAFPAHRRLPGPGSVVYLAWEPELKRHVAVKLFAKNSLIDPHSREHWLGEARALSRVPHDHVVAIHRVGETEEWLWLVLEYVSGGTLKDRLGEPLASRDAARLAEIIARAVGYFHSSGVWHLDLKPSNILLDGERGVSLENVSPKISDFGIARLEGEPGTTQTGANGPKGTPSYMAPEQVACLPGTIGAAADIHALGALLYHLLTGRPPFQGASSAETLDQVRDQDPVAPRRLNSRIPRDLETISLKCLEKAPNRRYASALVLAGDLRLWLEGRPIKARRVSPLGHGWRWCRRHPAVAGLLATVATMLIAGVAGLVVLLNQAAAERSRLAESRRKSETYEQFTANAAEQLAELVRMAHGARQGTPPGHLEEATLLNLRSAITDLKSRGIVPQTNLGILEWSVGNALNQGGTTEAGRNLLSQSATDLKQVLANNPDDGLARFWLLRSLYALGTVAEGAGQLEGALNWYEQAAAIQIELGSRDSDGVILFCLYYLRENWADRLRQNSRPDLEDRSGRVSQKVQRYLLGSDPAGSADVPPMGLETLARILQRHDLKILASSAAKGPRDVYAHFVAEEFLMLVGPLSPFRSPSAAAAYDRDPEAGAVALISEIRDKCSKLGLAPSMVPSTIESFWDGEAFEAAAEQRRVGRLDAARATASRLMALARRLVAEYPNSAHSYRLLSHAHNQIKKNAIQSAEYALIQESFVKAIEAARKSLDLDPDRSDARRHLERLTEQFARFKADRKGLSSATP